MAAAVAMMIAMLIRQAKIEPVIESMRMARRSFGLAPRSTTAAAWYSCTYGVIVVPISATTRNRNSLLRTMCGHSVFDAT
jgi:hypothetical protein